MRVVFAGTPDFSIPCLNALYEAANVEVVGIYTQPDRPAGRGKKVQPSPIKKLAMAHDSAIFQPHSLRSEDQIQQLQSLDIDLMVVTAYGLILPQSVLDIPRLGCVNVHASLLPRWRGAAPIQRAIEAGDQRSGVTLMQMELGLDSGPVLAESTIDITPEDTGGSLHDRLSTLGGQLLSENLRSIETQTLVALPQNPDQVCYAHKLNKAESALDLKDAAQTLERKIRAFDPWPGTTLRLNSQTLKILNATTAQGDALAPIGAVVNVDRDGIAIQTGKGLLNLKRLQKPGGKPMPVSAFLNGTPLLAGMTFDVI